MTNLNRRNFLGFTSAFIGSAVAAPAFATPSTTEKWDMTTDIVIVGAGGAGLDWLLLHKPGCLALNASSWKKNRSLADPPSSVVASGQ